MTLCSAPLAARAETWTDARVRDRVHADPVVDARRDATVARAEARARAALPYDNPFIGGQREQSFGPSLTGTAEDYIWIGQTFDPSFRRGLLTDAGRLRGDAARLEHEALLRARTADALALFAEVLARERIVDAHASWLTRLDASMALVSRREAAGDASRYDVLRLARERALAAQALDDARVDVARARAALAHMVDDDERTLVVAGDLAPPSPPEHDDAAPRPLLAQARDVEARALGMEEAAAARWFLPPVTITAGGKTVFAPSSTELGYLVTAQIPIPLFERDQGARAERRAEASIAQADAELLTRVAHRDAAAARAEWRAALRALDEHRARSSADDLAATARAAWTGGEIPIDALLDAERAARDDALYAVSLARRARLAFIQWSFLTEEVSP